MNTTEIRRRFLDYFARHSHEIVPSSSLVPGNDPTLLFTNAGMVQFKEVFLGDETRNYQRATTAQRCVRAGGKHNDLENVGYTARHHTFFEMLGNFSFGDYFKEQAIHYAWELLTKEFRLPPEKLWITVFEEDEEAESIWLNQIGIPSKRVARVGAKDNFWQMGDTGPCGPCSEIFYDHGPEVAGGPPNTSEAEGDRYVEIWNLVFMQFNRNSNGDLEPLPKPSVDTGMGLERMAAVLQGVHSNYEIDLFQNLISATADVLGVREMENKSLNVIADHIRSISFLIADGVIPSNEGRGYVLRRIIRRAIRHGYQAGHKKPFMHLLVDPLISEMGEAYPELVESGDWIKRVLEQENEKFNETLEQGLKILNEEIKTLSGNVISGSTVFRLNDTYGFPADLTADVVREHGLTIDSEGFESAMESQRNRARSANKFVQGEQIRVDGMEPTPFVGYQNLEYEVMPCALLVEHNQVDELKEGDDGIIILNETPFYAQSGGQVGDQGRITFSDTEFEVSDTRYLANKVIGHFGKVVKGRVALAQSGKAIVNASNRHASANNHSATHLLHAALKRMLGNHVDQKGSLVEPRRLRFDFSHYESVPNDMLLAVEKLVNQNIRTNHRVRIDIMDLESAKSAGAAALFGEKYDSQVRVVRMGGFSFELCGGTHVNRTGDIGLFKIVSESGVAAGVRRIEAYTAEAAEEHVVDQFAMMTEAAIRLKTTPSKMVNRISGLLEIQKLQARQIKDLQEKMATGAGSSDMIKEIGGIKVAVVQQDNADVNGMRTIVDQWRNKLQSGVVLVAGVQNNKVTLIAGISKDLNDRLHAGKLIAEISQYVAGSGGGRPDLAQGGGSDVAGVAKAIDATYKWVEKTLDEASLVG